MEHGGGPEWAVWLQEGAVGRTMRESFLLYPLVNVLHILGFTALAGGILAVDLRLVGLGRRLPLDQVARVMLPVALVGLAVSVPTGALLFVTEAVGMWTNPVFGWKVGIIALAGANALALHAGPWRRVAEWGAPGVKPPVFARAAGAASLLFWMSALILGRLIAYF
ncbi:MAG: hypothetical protein NTY59_15510 [Alphaproteobacteria bacterium]|nr:hypothetical protein [Alphaproteobacteria bacterium]